jgi:hypothetical protein
MSVQFNFQGGTLYQKVDREFKDMTEEALKKEQEMIKRDKSRYQDITITDSNGKKEVFKAVTFRDSKDSDNLITVRLTDRNIENLKNKFEDSEFTKMENGSIRMLGDAEEFLSTWFEDIKYNRGFDKKGADFNVEYEYLDKKLGGEVSKIDVKMSNQYMSLGKMKNLAGLIREQDLKGLTKEQKTEIEDEVKRANIMSRYFKEYISIFEADKGKNLTDELNTTLRIDENFDGQIDINENFKRDKNSPSNVQEFFSKIVEDFNKNYSNEEFAKDDFEKDLDIDFMSFADKEALLEKIKGMKNSNDIESNSEDGNYDNAVEQKEKVINDVVVNITKGKTALEQNWQMALDLLFDNKILEEEPKKVKTEKDLKQDELQSKVEDSLKNSFDSLGIKKYEEQSKIMSSISAMYNTLYKDSDIENFVNKLYDDFTTVNEYELDNPYNVSYDGYLGAKEFLSTIKEYANKRDYSDSYIASKEFQKEFFTLYNDGKRAKVEFGTNSIYGFARNLVRAKEQPDYTWKAKFTNMADTFLNMKEQEKYIAEITLLKSLVRDL